LTVLIALAVRPTADLSPYLLMGADSLKINVSTDFKELNRDEDATKIHKINNKLVSMAGRIDTNFMEHFLDFVRENDTEVTDLSHKCLEYIKEFVSSDEAHEDTRFAVYIGSCENRTPKLAYIEVKKFDLPNYQLQVMEAPEVDSFAPGYAGSFKFPEDDDLTTAFEQRVINNCFNRNLTCVKKAAKDFLISAASRYPETCNQNIKFEFLR
jgi:anaerobic ribonucleoside-triphosphate reductase